MQILKGDSLLKEIEIDYNCFSDKAYSIEEWYGNEFSKINKNVFYLVDNELSIHDENIKKEMLESC